MKKCLILAGICLAFVSSLSAQVPTVPFLCPGDQVIAYKNGTNCTAAPYNFYTVNAAGTQASTPFYTLTNVNREVNGLGINPVDAFLYGIEYDRIAVGPSCTFANMFLVRYDAAGVKSILGALPAPTGGAAQPSTGCITQDGSFIYLSADVNGRCLSVIRNIATLPNTISTLTAQFKSLTNSTTPVSYADWAVSPTDHKIYSYGIYSTAGVSTGIVVQIDPVTGATTTKGLPTYTTFSDVSRDNFGGVYFRPDGMLYGVNINTRRLYRVDVTTGAIQHISTFPGSGQMRADMGSCTSGHILLPVHFTGASITSSNNRVTVNWQVGETDDLLNFIVEQEQNGRFVPVTTLTPKGEEKSFSVLVTPKGNTIYRVRAVLNSQKSIYSSMLKWTDRQATISILQNPVVNGKVELVLKTTNTKNIGFTIINAFGETVKKGFINSNAIPVAELKPGMYFIQTMEETLRFIKM